MTAYEADEVIERMEAALACQSVACREAHRERDSARDIAARLESEAAALRVCLHVANYMHAENGHKYTDEEDWIARCAVDDFINTGIVSADALALAERLS